MSTNRMSLNKTNWIKISDGPVFVETPMLSNVAVYFGSQEPAANSEAFHGLFGPDSISYEGTESCYVRALNDAGTVIFTST